MAHLGLTEQEMQELIQLDNKMKQSESIIIQKQNELIVLQLTGKITKAEATAEMQALNIKNINK